MKRLDYETLAMEEIVVEMENGFLGASVDVENPKEDYGRINPHEVNTEFTTDFTTDQTTNVWD